MIDSSALLSVVVPRALRMNLLVRLIIPWRLPAWAVMTRPLADTLNRFLQLDLVFILGISGSSSGSVGSPASACLVWPGRRCEAPAYARARRSARPSSAMGIHTTAISRPPTPDPRPRPDTRSRAGASGLARVGGVDQTLLAGCDPQDVGRARHVEGYARCDHDLIGLLCIALGDGGAGGVDHRHLEARELAGHDAVDPPGQREPARGIAQAGHRDDRHF